MADTSLCTPADEMREAALSLRTNPQRPVDVPLAAWLEQAAHDFDVEVEEHRPDCCGDVHEEPGLLHMDGCGGWVTVYRDHGGVPCGCFGPPLAVARVLNGTTPQEVSVS